MSDIVFYCPEPLAKLFAVLVNYLFFHALFISDCLSDPIPEYVAKYTEIAPGEWVLK